MLADDGLVLEIGRFDPGKVSSQDKQILLPTTTLPGDYIISLIVVSELEDIRIDVIDIVTQIVVIEVPH